MKLFRLHSSAPRSYHNQIWVLNYPSPDSILVKCIGSKRGPQTPIEALVGIWKIKQSKL